MKKLFLIAKKPLSAIFAAMLVLQLTSCYSTTTCVGNISPEDPVVEVNKVMNHHFLFGLINGGKTNIKDKDYIKENQDYKVKKQHTFVDGLLNFITLGIYNPTTTTYYVPLNK